MSRRAHTPLIALATTLALATAGCQTDSDADKPSGSRSSAPLTSQSPQPEGRDTYLGLPVDRLTQVTALDDLPFPPMTLVASSHPDRLWIGSEEGLAWIDPADNTSHVVDRNPGVNLAVQGDRLYRAAWAKDNVAVYSIDGKPKELSRTRAPSPLNITAGPAGVWAADHNHGNLLRLDPDTAEVTRKVPVGKGPTGVGRGPAGMVWFGDDLWVNSKRDGNLCEVDGRTGRTLHCVHITNRDIDDGISLTPDGIWAAVGDTEQGYSWQVLVDPQSRQVVARQLIERPFTEATLGEQSVPVMVGKDLWLPSNNYLVHLAPSQGYAPNRVLQIPVRMNARDATVAFGSLWVCSRYPEPPRSCGSTSTS